MAEARVAMAEPVRAICADASVGAKWFLPDEEDAREAIALLDKFVLGSLRILVPNLFFYELGNVMSVALRRRRITEAAAVRSLDVLGRLHLERIGLEGEMDSALAFSRRYGVSFYDAAYMAAAESRGVPLVTCDRRLLAAARPHLDWVLTPAEVVGRI